MCESNVQGAAIDGQIETRIEAVRKRFAAKFMAGMQRTVENVSRMTGEGIAPADIVAKTYRWIHEVSGIASTIGFESTGRSARSCDDLLVEPHRAQRGLSAAELTRLIERLESLRLAARDEMQFLESSRG